MLNQGAAMLSGIILACHVAGASAWAQERETTTGNGRTVQATERNTEFTLSGGFEHVFESDLESGGDVSVSRFSAGLDVRTDLNPELNLRLLGSFSDDAYDFSGVTALSPTEPWEDIHTIDFGALLSYDVAGDWTAFGGPVFQFSRESGADWDDAFIGGGVVGATYRFSRDLTLGGGVGLVSQIEDDLRVFPVIVLEWRIADDLRISTQSARSAAGRSGVELIWECSDSCELALGGAYEFRRFRLDDDGVAPGGVGEETGIPLWLRASLQPGDNVSVSIFGGVAAGREMELSTSDGDVIAFDDVDTGYFAGVSVNLRF